MKTRYYKEVVLNVLNVKVVILLRGCREAMGVHIGITHNCECVLCEKILGNEVDLKKHMKNPLLKESVTNVNLKLIQNNELRST